MLVAEKEKFYSSNDFSFGNHRDKTQKYNKENKNKKRVSWKIKIFAIAFLVLVMCLLVLLRYAQITQVRYEITALDNEIVELNKVKQQLSAQLDSLKESEWIERRAIEELGMMYPTEEQIVFISVEGDYNEETIAQQDETNNDAVFLKAFGDIFGKIIGLSD